MNVHRLASSVLVQAPAKLNLFFEILCKRGDGYHEIETLMVPISLWDTLVATSDPSGRVGVDCRWALPAAGDVPGDLPREQDNLATRAIHLLRCRAGVEHGISIELAKRIPSAAGLGGGSSDAAAALLAANELWGLGWSRDALMPLGAELGSDVPFFLGRGAAICRGRGERVEPLAGTGPLDFVVVRPPQGLSTSQVYENCRVSDEPRRLGPLVAALRAGDFRGVARESFNRLEEAAAALSGWVGRLRASFAEQDCVAAQLSGSGSGYFGICRHARHARHVARRLRSRGVGHVYAVHTTN